MALSEKWVLEKARELLWDPRYTGFNPVAFTRAIEAEIRKDDEALIRQLVESLEGYRRNHNDGQPCDAEKAARARLEKAP